MTGDEIDELEIRLLGEQLRRMRGLLAAYSALFFGRIRDWAFVSITLLVVAQADVARAAIVFVPFVVPFAFLETAYLFFYTVFARRFAERLEMRLNARLGREVLVAHRLEAAYFYPPDAPKIAALSLGRPLGLVSVSTLGYTVGAALLWLAGFVGLVELAGDDPGPASFLPVVALIWTAVIAGYLVWTFLTRHDEARLVRELDRWHSVETPPPSR